MIETLAYIALILVGLWFGLRLLAAFVLGVLEAWEQHQSRKYTEDLKKRYPGRYEDLET